MGLSGGDITALTMACDYYNSIQILVVCECMSFAICR